jgi:cell division protein FtsX
LIALALVALLAAACGGGTHSVPANCLVRINFTKDATAREESHVRATLKADGNVRELIFRSKEAAIKALRKKEPVLANQYPINLFRDAFEVVPSTTQEVNALLRKFARAPGVESTFASQCSD